MIYTNLGQGGPIDGRLQAAGRSELAHPEHIIELHHGRGRDELFEASKEDVTERVLPVTAQATRVRRQAIDFAAKIVRHAGETVLKVTAVVWHRLNIPELRHRAANPPPFAWV